VRRWKRREGVEEEKLLDKKGERRDIKAMNIYEEQKEKNYWNKNRGEKIYQSRKEKNVSKEKYKLCQRKNIFEQYIER